MIEALFAVVAGGYWHHAAFHVAAIVGWDNERGRGRMGYVECPPRRLEPTRRPAGDNKSAVAERVAGASSAAAIRRSAARPLTRTTVTVSSLLRHVAWLSQVKTRPEARPTCTYSRAARRRRENEG